MKRLLLLFLPLFLSLAILAQRREGQVTGTVSDGQGEPLAGVIVKTADGKTAAATDVEGRFVLAAQPGAVLTFSYVGFKKHSQRATAKAMRVQLEEDLNLMKQVVIDGYQQSDIRKTTGSVGILTAEDLKDQPLANVDQLMQGKLPGVNVTTVSGRPGSSAQIRIRGISSITGSSEPLWVVDGVPLQKEIPSMGSTYVRSGDFSKSTPTAWQVSVRRTSRASPCSRMRPRRPSTAARPRPASSSSPRSGDSRAGPM